MKFNPADNIQDFHNILVNLVCEPSIYLNLYFPFGKNYVWYWR
jgi:hypothetical protein